MSLEGKDIVNAAKKRPLVFVCVSLAVVLLGYIYLRSDAVSTLQAELDDRSDVLRKAKVNLTYSVQLDAHVKAMKGVNDAIKASALKSDDLAQGQQMFYLMESETGVVFTRFTQQKAAAVPLKGAAAVAAAASVYAPLAFSITAEADYVNVLTFLKRVESGAALSRINSSSITMGPDGLPSLDIAVEVLGLRP